MAKAVSQTRFILSSAVPSAALQLKNIAENLSKLKNEHELGQKTIKQLYTQATAVFNRIRLTKKYYPSVYRDNNLEALESVPLYLLEIDYVDITNAG